MISYTISYTKAILVSKISLIKLNFGQSARLKTACEKNVQLRLNKSGSFVNALFALPQRWTAAQRQIINLGRERRANKRLPHSKSSAFVLRFCVVTKCAGQNFVAALIYDHLGRMSRCFALCAALGHLFRRCSSNFLTAWWMGIIFCRLVTFASALKQKVAPARHQTESGWHQLSA